MRLRAFGFFLFQKDAVFGTFCSVDSVRFFLRVGQARMARNVYAKTEAECEMKLAELIREMKEEIAAAKEHRKPDDLAG